MEKTNESATPEVNKTDEKKQVDTVPAEAHVVIGDDFESEVPPMINGKDEDDKS